MKQITPVYLAKGMQAIERNRLDSIYHLAGKITPILQAFCDKHKVYYLPGNGTYLFAWETTKEIIISPSSDERPTPRYDHSSEFWKEYVKLCALLDAPVTGDVSFSQYVEEYHPKEVPCTPSSESSSGSCSSSSPSCSQ